MAGQREGKSLVVIGGGICGLSAALTWAINKDCKINPVTLVEKEPKTGGFVTSYEREGFLFDTCQMIPNMDKVLEYLGIKIDLKQFRGYYMRIFLVNPDTREVKKLEIPSGVETFKQYLVSRYPEDAKAVGDFLDYSRDMFMELHKMKVEPKIPDILRMLVSCRKIIKNSSKTFKEYMEQFGITNPEVCEIFNVFSAFSALPEEKVAALVPVSAMNSLLDGAFRPTEGFIEFPKSLEKRFLECGGILKTRAAAEEIITENGRVKAVRTKGGETFPADYVITTVDPKFAMTRLLDFSALQELDRDFADKVSSVKMSTSSMNISLGLDDKLDLAGLGMDCGYNVITTGGETFNQLWEVFEKGEIGFSESRFHLGVICPSLTTGGKPNLTIRVVPMALGEWAELRKMDRKAYNQEKERLGDFFIDLVEQYLIPDLKRHIVVKNIASPATYARYSGSPTGSIYDMAPYIDNFGRTRLKMRTPVKGLYQPKFVHGVFGALLGGVQAVDMILEGEVMNGNARF